MHSAGSVTLFLALLSAVPVYSAGPDDVLPAHRAGTVLLKFQGGVSSARAKELLNQVGGASVKQLGSGVMVVNVGNGRVFGALQSLKHLNEISYVEPDFKSLAGDDVSGPITDLPELNAPTQPSVTTATAPRALTANAAAQSSTFGVSPNDSNINNQWAINNTGQNSNGTTGTAGADERAQRAWSSGAGSASVVVAVLDTGVQYSHPDLYTNIWTNPGSVGGCASGTHGYNVLNQSCDPMDDDTAYGGHGSHVAGILGAVGNNAAGVAGVNWTSSILPVKWVSSGGGGYTSDLISAMDWVITAKQSGVNIRVVNDSQTWPGTAFSQSLSDEIDALTANDILFVSAAGNTADNNDSNPRYPCSYARPGMLCAAASDQNDKLWSSSNYGVNSVQLAAPGVNIFSTLRSSNYGYISGGSMAAAEVSGAAALVLSSGYLSVTDLRTRIMNTVDVLSSLSGLVGTGGRLNVCNAVPSCAAGSSGIPSNTAPPSVVSGPVYGSQVGAATGGWSGTPTSYAYQWYRCDGSGANCSSITGATSSVYAILAGADKGATLEVAVTASNASGSTTTRSAASKPVATASSPFAMNSTVADGQTVSGSLGWQASPAQAVQFVQFYVDGVLSQTVSASPYVYNKSTSGTFDSTVLSNGTHVLGIRALSTGNKTYAFYGATITVANTPVNTAAPVISGTPAVGQRLNTSNGSWSNNPSSFTYAWNRCDTGGNNCSVIAGATTSGYTVAAADAGLTIRSRVTAANSAGSSSAQSAPVQVAAGSLSITTTSLPNATQNTAYNTSLAAAGGTTPYSWSVASGSLPAGLSLAGSTGVISGTPTTAGTSNFTVRVTDNGGQTATKALTLTVTASGGTGGGISLVQANAAQGSAVTSVSVGFPSNSSAGNLIIAFVRLSSTTQTVRVSDSAHNTYADAVSQAQSSDGHQVHIFYAKNIVGGADTVTATFSSSNGHPWLAIYEYHGLSTTNPLDRTAAAQGSSATASAGPTATTTSANELMFVGTGLPASYGGTVSAATGFTVTQRDNTGSTAANEMATLSSTGAYTGSFALSSSTNWSAVAATFIATGSAGSPSITTTSLSDATQNTAYNTSLTATGGTTPYGWSVASGSLPAGLSLAGSTGVISGTPTTAGTSNFTVRVTDNGGQTATKALTLTVDASSGTGGGISLVQANAAQGSAVTSVSVGFPSNSSAGNLIIAFVRLSSTTQTVTVSDSAHNTYADAVSQAQSSDGHQVHIFYAKNIVGGADTVTATFSSSNGHPWLAIYEYHGLSTTNPLDRTAAAQGSSATASAGPTATTTSANELMFVGTGLPASYGGTVSAATGFTVTQRDNTGSTAANEMTTLSSTGAYTGSFALSSSTNWSAVVATFKP